MKKLLSIAALTCLLAFASTAANAFIVQDQNGQLWDCWYSHGGLFCIPLDYMPPIEP